MTTTAHNTALVKEFSNFSSGSPGSLIRALHGTEVALWCTLRGIFTERYGVLYRRVCISISVKVSMVLLLLFAMHIFVVHFL
jgi:hypothetical protein